MQLEKLSGQNKTADILKRIVDLLGNTKGGPHTKTLYARYLVHSFRNSRMEEAIRVIKQAVNLSPNQSVKASDVDDNVLLGAYGSIWKKKLQLHNFSSGNKSANDEVFQHCIETAEEALCAYKKGQRLTKYSQVTGNREFNIRCFIGEAETRLLLLQRFFTHKFRRNHSAFSEFLQKTDVSLLKESETEICQVLDNLDYLIMLGRIADDDNEFTTRTIYQIKGDLYRLRADYDNIEVALRQLPANIPCDIGELVRYNNNIGKKRYWKDLPIDSLELIITLIEARLMSEKGCTIRSNYEDILTAMIFIRQCSDRKKYLKYNIDLALHYATEWKRRYPDNYNAHFMLGVLQVAKSLQENDNSLMQQAVISLRECTEICDKWTTKSYRALRYMIGNGSGLQKVLPYEEGIGCGKLHLFEGRQIDSNSFIVDPFQSILKIKLHRSSSSQLALYKDQQREWKFNIVIARDNIFAINVESV